jgi:uncharacterized phage protein (TIGR02218 family)
VRQLSGALISLLNSSSQFQVADLMTVIQQDGTITRYTSAPVALRSTSLALSFADATVYTFNPLVFSRGKTTLKVGLEVDDMPIVIAPGTATLSGLPWPKAILGGALDYARIVIERAFMPTWGDTSAGTVIAYAGNVGTVTTARNAVSLTVKSDLAVLALPLPRNVYQPGCLHALYDTGCTLSQAAFTDTGSAAIGATASVIPTTLVAAAGYYELGVITFTSGANASAGGRLVKTYTNVGGTVTVVPPFPSAPSNGDAFEIYPGCDKTQATCDGKFSNLANFRGFPYVPVPEANG